jgi:ADP-heptose:LPS heptosyltransferase
MPLLENNPDIDSIIVCNAPWHNKQNCRFGANSPMTFLEGLLYVLFSKESKVIRKQNFSHGIDVLGSRQGSWLLRFSKIYHRFGVKGYAGGDNWCQKCVIFKEDRNVAEAILDFLTLMGCDHCIDPRPRIYLTRKEIQEGEYYWGEKLNPTKRIIIAPGAGFPEKCWGNGNFTQLTKLLLKDPSLQIIVIGTKEDSSRIKIIPHKRLQNLCGGVSLRQSAALVSHSDFVISNSSFCMHLAGAFKVPALTMLGDWYDSASLHQKQWGYNENTVLGKESDYGISKVTPVDEAYRFVLNKLNSCAY